MAYSYCGTKISYGGIYKLTEKRLHQSLDIMQLVGDARMEKCSYLRSATGDGCGGNNGVGDPTFRHAAALEEEIKRVVICKDKFHMERVDCAEKWCDVFMAVRKELGVSERAFQLFKAKFLENKSNDYILNNCLAVSRKSIANTNHHIILMAVDFAIRRGIFKENM